MLGHGCPPASHPRLSSGPMTTPLSACVSCRCLIQEVVKNRVRLDLSTSTQDRAHEVERLVALGARRGDIGRTARSPWTVLADPQSNEFCVIHPKQTLIRFDEGHAHTRW